MTTQELKNKIEKVLGNSIRCLLPSYWWKNLFHSVADRIDEVEVTVSDMVVKSLKEFEAKHPDMASNTLILTEDETSAEARSNATKLLKWARKVTISPAKAAVNPLYIAVPILDEEFAYSIQTPSYGLGKKGVIFYGVRMLGGQAFNIEFDLDTGVALESTSESEGGGLVFVCGIDVSAQELVFTSNEDKEVNQKSYEEYLNLLHSGKPANLKLRYYFGNQNGTKAYYTDVYPKIAGYNPITFPQYNGISFCDVEVLTTKMDFVFDQGGEVSIYPHATLGEANFVYAAYDGLSLNDIQISNNKKMYQYMLEGRRLPVVVRMMYPLGEAVFSSRWFQYEEDGTTKIRFFAFGDEMFHMELTEDGQMTILGTFPIVGSSGGVEIRELYIYEDISGNITELTEEQKAWNLETFEFFVEKKAIVRYRMSNYQWFYLDTLDNGYMRSYIATAYGVVCVSLNVDEEGLAYASTEAQTFDDTVSMSNKAVQSKAVKTALDGKQDSLVSGINIKTINNQSILGSGNITIEGGSNVTIDSAMSSTSTNPVQNKVVYSELQKKQGTINDLADIRSGAALGKTALQQADIADLATKDDITNLTNGIIANEEVHAAALNDLNERLNNISDSSSEDLVTFYLLGGGSVQDDTTKALNKHAYEAFWAYDEVPMVNVLMVVGESNSKNDGFEALCPTSMAGAPNEDLLIIASPYRLTISPDGNITLEVADIPDEVTIDDAMSDTSENAVKNKVIKQYVDEKVGNIDFSSLATKEEVQNLTNEIIANDEIVKSSLNDLEERKVDNTYIEELDERKADKQYVDDAIANLDIDTSELVTKDEFVEVEEVWATSYNKLNQKISDVQQYIYDEAASRRQFDDAITEIQSIIADNEAVTATSWNILNQKISDVQRYIYDEAASRRQFDEAIDEIQSIIAENEAITTAAWNQLNTRIAALEAAQRQGE